MSISSQTVTVAEATKTKVEVGNCRKELHAMVKRLSTMKRQLLAQKEYIEVAVKDALAELNSSPAETSPYNNKSIKDKIVDYRVKLYKHRAFIGRLNSSDVIDDMHAPTPVNNTEITAGYTRAIKSGGGLKVPIFNSSQILPGVTNSVNDPERIAPTSDTEVFNGVDIIGTKQFLIGVNAILTHPNNISETLVPATEVLNPAEEKRTYSSVWADPPPHALGTGFAQSMIYSEQAWSANTYTGRPFVAGQEWMKIELPSVKLVTGVVTQGMTWVDGGGWTLVACVKTLTVKTSIDNNKLSLVDSDKIFEANTLSALSTPKTIPFEQPVLAKYVIIYPQDYERHPSMRAGVLVRTADPLEDTPYKSIGTAGELRVFNDDTYPYSAGAKHALSTGVLKGLLMQGNENITGTDSSDSIGNAIPTGGKDSVNNAHFEVIRGFGLD